MLIVWGTKTVKRVLGSGSWFQCPRCQSSEPYRHCRVRRYGHLYWIPLIPLGEPVEYVECLTCQSTWKPEVLTIAPPENHRTRGFLDAALLTVAIAAAAADKEVRGDDVDVILRVLEPLVAGDLKRSNIEELAYAPGANHFATAEHFLTRVAASLDETQKGLLLLTGVIVSQRTGQPEAKTLETAKWVGGVIGMSDVQVTDFLTKTAR